MTTRKRALEILLAVTLTFAGIVALAVAQQSANRGIGLTDAWARPSIGKIANSAAYLTITNSGPSADELLAVEGAVADAIEIHEHRHDGGVMRMRRVEGGVPVAAGQSLIFAPAGYHIMLIGLAAPLKEGASFPLTLTFERAGKIALTVPVRRQAP